jgi:F-type H+-transporting ATPase subunit b
MLKSLPLTLLLLAAFATPAVAQEGGLLDVNTGLMVWTVIIFLAVLGLLYWKAYPPILGAVEARERRIAELLAAAQRDREEAQTLIEEQRARHEELRAQVQEMVAEGKAAGERMREEIIAEARREQQAILERARREIAQEAEQALADLKAQAVDLAIAAASRLIQKDLDGEGNRRLVQQYLDQLELEESAAVAARV